MEIPQDPFVFISVFYAREQWHKLLPAIQKELCTRPESDRCICGFFVFLSSHRGDNIRVILKYKHPSMKSSHKKTVEQIDLFLSENPSNSKPVQLPLTGFFADFPNNRIKYNLYNERTIKPEELAIFQYLLSKILLVFFEDHMVDDDAVFTLVVYLQEQIINALCDTSESREDLVQLLIAKSKKRSSENVRNEADLKYFPILADNQDIYETSGIDHLLRGFENATNSLYAQSGDKIVTYFTVIRVIQLHIFDISSETFLDSLEYLSGSYQPG